MTVGFINGVLNSAQNNSPDYWVGADTDLYQYQTIQSAIDAAVADGASSSNFKNVIVTPKSSAYTEALTMANGINLIGDAASSLQSNVVVEAPASNPCIDVGTGGIMSFKNIRFRASAGENVLEHGALISILFIEAWDCIFDAQTNSGTNALSLDAGGSGQTITLLFYTSQMLGGTAAAVEAGQGVTANFLLNCTLEGNNLGLDMTDNSVVTCWNFAINRPCTATNTSSLTTLFGGWNPAGGVPLTLTGSAQCVMAMSQVQAPTNFQCLKIGAGCTATCFFCPMIATGTAPFCVDENGPGDAGTFARGACFAAGSVTTINGTLTAVAITPL